MGRLSPAALQRAVPVIFVLIWSTGFVVARYGMPHAGPMDFLALRFLFSVLLFLGWRVLRSLRYGGLGLSVGEPGRDQRAGGQEDPAQGQGNGLHDLRLEGVQRTGRKPEAARVGRLRIRRQQVAPAVRPHVQPCHQVSAAFWTAPM